MHPALCHSPLTRCGTARCTQRAMETSNGPILTEQQLRVPSGTRRDNGETPRGSRSNGDCARQTVSVALEQRRCLTDKDEPRSSPAALEPPIHRTNGEIQMGGTLSVYFKRRSFCSDVEQMSMLSFLYSFQNQTQTGFSCCVLIRILSVLNGIRK
ncbi:hypothetical protein DPX16_22446 [Anabarilius grahami]|uniref:Uncharacterized protein n=1 Tax=Anabarilius grahami TaxID=495550 RepID=A0A3N0YYW6_ANAGA|nr:hypothetical protein DPX16_22446 [Anabarilius grahami]